MDESTGPVVVGLRAGRPTTLLLAMREAQRRDRPLRVVHAVWMPPPEARQLKGEQMRAAGQRVLDDARDVVEQDAAAPPTQYVLSARPPVETLLHESGEACLLVLGTDQVRWFERMIGGEVTTYVARHASCPVLVVPEATSLGRSGEVVVAIDADGLLDEPLHCAFEEARRSRSRVRVLHASPRDRATPDPAQATIGESVTRWQARYPDVSVSAEIVREDPEGACLRAGQRAEVLVVGRPRRPGGGLLREKPVAVRILRHATCPVLVAPPADPS